MGIFRRKSRGSQLPQIEIVPQQRSAKAAPVPTGLESSNRHFGEAFGDTDLHRPRHGGIAIAL